MAVLITLPFIVWNVRSNVFPGLDIPKWYGLCWALGVFSGYQVMACIYRKEGKNINELDTLATYVLVGAILGARFGHILFYDPLYYLQHPVEILPIRLSPSFEFTGLSGLASHGGGVGIFIAIFLYCRKYKEHYIQLLDKTAIAVALVGAFIRFGNLINSEIIGIPTNVPWAFVFTKIDQLPRHPAQLYESVFCLFLFMLLFYVWRVKRGRIQNGFLLGIFLVLLFSFRFMDEFLKIDQEPFESGLFLKMGQILSIPFVLGGMGLIVKSLNKTVSR